MKYIIDKELKYVKDITKHLARYNVSYTGVRPTDEAYIYVLNNKALIGVLIIKLKWDCVFLNEYFYSNIDVLKLMLSKVCELYKEKAKAIRVSTDVLERINDFKELKFEIEGILQTSTKTSKKYYFAYYKFDIESNSNFEVIIKKDPILEYESIFKERLVKFREENKISIKKEELEIVALRNNNFVGGVKLTIFKDSIYVDMLVVIEKYRGENIGSKLMELVEEEAEKRNLDSVYLETVLSREFYEKMGYKKVVTKKNQPKDFNSYLLVKQIK